MLLREVAYCRAGDKGDTSNVLVVPHDETDYEWLKSVLTVECVSPVFAPLIRGEITRYEMPGIRALNFVMTHALHGGVSRSLCLDMHGKARASLMLGIGLPTRPRVQP
jgi:hypothetical protein